MSEPLRPIEEPPEEEGGRVTLLEQGLWRRLTAAETAEDAARAWAPLMASMIDGAEMACVFLVDREGGGRLRAVAAWPETRLPGGALLAAASDAVEADRGVVRGTLGSDGPALAIAAPLSLGEEVLGAVGLEARPRTQAELRAAMRRLQWGAAWMRDALRHDQGQEKAARYDQAVHALGVVVGVAEQRDLPTATRAAATDLATRFGCDRVSIGFRRLGRCKVAAISHSAQFGKRMNLVRLLGAAMDEAVDQRGLVLWPHAGADQPMAAHRHERLARAHGVGQILTVPLYAVDHFVGAVTFERPADRPFGQHDLEVLEAVATVLAPVLDEKRRNDRWLLTKALEILAQHFGRLVGPRRLGRKAAALAVVGLAAFLWFATGTDRVTADAKVEGRVQRFMVAPVDGFIAEAPVRPGDAVARGELLVRLDDRELALERLRLVTELERQRIEYDTALAAGERSDASIRRSEIDQSEAQIALIDQQIERMRLVAPFDGLVIAGDLSQSIGAAVARGDALMTLAPGDGFRVTMRVDEGRIDDMAVGQVGSLVVAALPERSFPVEIARITPVAEYADGATSFRVEAALPDGGGGLQPGMEGVVKVEIEDRRLATIWTQPLTDWARLWAWRWLGWRPE